MSDTQLTPEQLEKLELLASFPGTTEEIIQRMIRNFEQINGKKDRS